MQRLHSATVSDAAGVRLDTDTVRQVLSRASEIEQQTEHEMLSVEQVEALGQELGLSPESIRRALGEVAQVPMATPSIASTSHSRQLRQSDIKTALRPGLWYSFCSGIIGLLIMGVSEATRNSPSNLIGGMMLVTMILSVLIGPLVAAALTGWRSHHIRSGALGGFFLGFMTFVTNFFVYLPFALARINMGDLGIPPGAWVLVFMMIFLSPLFGAMGGAAWRWWNSLAKHDER